MYIQNWADAVIVRHRDISMLEIMANTLSIPVVNAMTDENHPCEIMSDLYTLSKIRTDYLRDNYLFVGADGNIGRAWKEAAEAFGFRLNQSSPSRYQVPGVSCNENLKEAIVGTDIICTDSIPSNMIDDFKDYQISKELMSIANENAILNPCPPFYKGEEVTEDVINSDYFVGYEFKKNPHTSLISSFLSSVAGSNNMVCPPRRYTPFSKDTLVLMLDAGKNIMIVFPCIKPLYFSTVSAIWKIFRSSLFV